MRRALFCLLCFLAFAPRVLEAAPLRKAQVAVKTRPGQPVVKPQLPLAPSWILMDAATGRVLAQRNAHQRMFPASTTKTMTALVALSQNSLDRVVRIGPNPPLVGESSVFLLQGEQFVMRDLVRAAMIKSANDSCVAIAEGVAGSVPAFVELMNRKAREIGARNTHFVNPHGLHDPNHYTTAYDLALIARAAMRYPFFNEVVSTREATIHGNWKIGPNRLLVNRNRLLFRWNESDGVKTGYTRQAGRCLIASATRWMRTPSGKTQPLRLISVVMHAPDTWADSRFILQNIGFAHFAPVAVTSGGEEFGAVPVVGGAFEAHAVTPRAVSVALRNDEQPAIERRVHLLPMKAPLRQGQAVGYVEFLSGAHAVAKAPLVAREDVPASVMARVLPPAAAIVPTNPSLRLGMYGAFFLSLALLLSVRKLRAQKPRGKLRKTPNTTTEYSIYGQPQSENIPPQYRRQEAQSTVARGAVARTAVARAAPATRAPAAGEVAKPARHEPGSPERPRPARRESARPDATRPSTSRPSATQPGATQRRAENSPSGQRGNEPRVEQQSTTRADAARSGTTQRGTARRGTQRPNATRSNAAPGNEARFSATERSGTSSLNTRSIDASSAAARQRRHNARAQRVERQASERRAQSEQTRAQLEAHERQRREFAQRREATQRHETEQRREIEPRRNAAPTSGFGYGSEQKGAHLPRTAD
ncbi:MAG TPA: D-alanyl-D-alanine carboxypeptidase [Abditibacteriaceae bacterium]|jgi:D-alanyl-D-alanine carboxypeptidase (penicillin-binding protein 5/6)